MLAANKFWPFKWMFAHLQLFIAFVLVVAYAFGASKDEGSSSLKICTITIFYVKTLSTGRYNITI